MNIHCCDGHDLHSSRRAQAVQAKKRTGEVSTMQSTMQNAPPNTCAVPSTVQMAAIPFCTTFHLAVQAFPMHPKLQQKSLYCYIVHQPVSYSATPYKYDQYMLNHIYSYGVDICSFVGALHHNTIRASPTIALKSQSSYNFWGLVLILYSPNIHPTPAETLVFELSSNFRGAGEWGPRMEGSLETPRPRG